MPDRRVSEGPVLGLRGSAAQEVSVGVGLSQARTSCELLNYPASEVVPALDALLESIEQRTPSIPNPLTRLAQTRAQIPRFDVQCACHSGLLNRFATSTKVLAFYLG